MDPNQSPVSSVRVRRGDVEESAHRVHVAVAGPEGRLNAWCGDPQRVTWYRSAAKPFQALPLVEDGVVDRFGITDAELALCCGSHEGEPEHVAAARSILSRAGLTEEALRCGPHTPFSSRTARALAERGLEPAPIHNNCSGKHAGMLALAVAHGWDLEGYHREGHPVQRRMLHEILRWSGEREGSVATGVDGCGVLCFAVPLSAVATSYARFAVAAREGGAAARVVAAMADHPFMVGGTRRAGTRVMECTGRRAFVKLGAEGVYGGGLPGSGRGFAIKVEDGGRRAVAPVLVHVLDALGALSPYDLGALEDLLRPTVTNTRGEEVGTLDVELALAGELEPLREPAP
jgi:L-asparaginase II